MNYSKTILFALILSAFTSTGFSQNINWGNLKEGQKHIVRVGIGWDYALVYGVGYSHQLNSKIPIVLNASYSFPSGGKVFDDFKTKVGGQAVVFQHNNLQLSTSVHAIYRRYENPLVCLQNFGGEVGAQFGYYQSRWFVAGEVVFDKAIATHVKHSASFKENVFADAKDGWIDGPTAGNFSFGLETGYSFDRSDIIFKIGKVVTQDFKTTPLIPYYLQLSYIFKIGTSASGNQGEDQLP